MDISAWIAFMIGIAAGGSIIYIRQRKLRMEELEKAAAMTEDILAGRKLRTSAPGDELLLARIENQLVRIQEMLDGRRKEAEKSRDEIQKLISEISFCISSLLFSASFLLPSSTSCIRTS